jgi:hypothetical protein
VVSELAPLRVKQIAAGGSAIAVLAEPDEKKSDTGLNTAPWPSQAVENSIPWGNASLKISYADRVKQVAVHNETVSVYRLFP